MHVKKYIYNFTCEALKHLLPMKELLLFRTFAMFPFIGTVAPDLANALHTTFSSIPAEHIIVDITLSVCLIVCTAGMRLIETEKLKKAST